MGTDCNEHSLVATPTHGEAIQALRSNGRDIAYLGTEVLLNDEGSIIGTMCCFDTESSELVAKANEQAGVPF